MILQATNSFWLHTILILHWATLYVPPPPPMCMIDINNGGVYSISGTLVGSPGVTQANYELKVAEQSKVGGLLNITFSKK